MTEMFNPPHPGETLREDVLPALGLSVTAAAEQLGVSRVTFSRVLHGRAAISAEMACRLEKWLGKANGGNAEVWLRMQQAYDLAQARKAGKKVIAKVKKAKIPAMAKANDERFALAA